MSLSTMIFTMTVTVTDNMSHVMRKPVFDICERQRHRSACASAQSDQHLCYLLLTYNICSFYMQKLKTLASLCCWAGRWESYLVGNPEDRFSHDVAHIVWYLAYINTNIIMRLQNVTELTSYDKANVFHSRLFQKKIMGVFKGAFILTPPPMRFNYCLGPPPIRSNYQSTPPPT